MRIGVILGCFYLLSGCATPYDTPIGVPERPYLIPITAEQQAKTPVDVLDIVAVNYEVLKNHVKRLERRILLHDELL